MADTTIHTVLGNLRNKGFIKPVPSVDRAVRYAPRVAKDRVGKRSLRRLLNEFFDGSPGRLMAHLIREPGLGEAELADIRKMLGAARKKGSKKS